MEASGCAVEITGVGASARMGVDVAGDGNSIYVCPAVG